MFDRMFARKIFFEVAAAENLEFNSIRFSWHFLQLGHRLIANALVD